MVSYTKPGEVNGLQNVKKVVSTAGSGRLENNIIFLSGRLRLVWELKG